MNRKLTSMAFCLFLVASSVLAEVPAGFIKDWLLCGPFPNPPNKPAKEGVPNVYDHTPPCVGLETDYLKEHGGEENIVPVVGMEHTKQDGTKVAWFAYTSPEYKVVFRKAITKKPNVVAYAYTTVEMDRAGSYLLGLGSDEGVRVWVNGALIHDKLIERPIREDDDLVQVELKKGKNTILVKVEQGWGGWGFALRIVPPNEVFSSVDTDMQSVTANILLRRQRSEEMQSVVLVRKGLPVASGVFKAMGDSPVAQCELTIPFPPPGEEFGMLDIVVNEEPCGQIEMPSLTEARERTIQWQKPIAYPGYVFSGTELPRIDFEKPQWIERLIGSYTITTTYYDSDHNEVTLAKTPGRYGAVAVIKTKGGGEYRRYVPLFRQESDVKWYEENEVVENVKLPSGLGISPEVVSNQQDTLTGFAKWAIASNMEESPHAAIMMAGLYEMQPNDPPAVERTGVRAINRKWWATLKEKLGVLEIPHLVYLPPDYDKDKNKKWPLVLFLHGAGERGQNLEYVKRNGIPKLTADGQQFPFIAISPQCPLGSWWTEEEANLAILLDRAEAKYRVDKDRIYCTGLSMGGYGTWALGMAYPDRFAAIAPICGGGDVRDVARLTDVPIWAFHGAKDSTVPVEQTTDLIDALKELGASPKLTIYPDAYHNSWGVTYENPEFYEWLLNQKLSNRPHTAP